MVHIDNCVFLLTNKILVKRKIILENRGNPTFTISQLGNE
jgi:hypothetical protein